MRICAIFIILVVGLWQIPALGGDGEDENGWKRAPKWYVDFSDRLSGFRSARCATAICFGFENAFALEPFVELPVGKSFSPSASRSSLGRYINSTGLSVSVSAGLRFWFLHDLISLSLYLSDPLLDGDDAILVPGVPYRHPASRVRRPYPGIGVGLAGDLLWIGLDYDVLYNGTGDDRDLTLARGEPVSRAWTISVALAPISMVRSGFGALSIDRNSEAVAPERVRDDIDEGGLEGLGDGLRDARAPVDSGVSPHLAVDAGEEGVSAEAGRADAAGDAELRRDDEGDDESGDEASLGKGLEDQMRNDGSGGED